MVQNAGLKVATGKSFFCRQKLKYLGHVVSAEGIEVDDEKVKAMKEPVTYKASAGCWACWLTIAVS